VKHAILAALLIVQDELHGDVSIFGPLRIGVAAAIALEVAGIGGVRIKKRHGRFPAWRG
jgi:hypothetical protein